MTYVPIPIFGNSAFQIECDTWWQFALTFTGGAIAMIFLAKLISQIFSFSFRYSHLDRLRDLCLMFTGYSMVCIGTWSNIAANSAKLTAAIVIFGLTIICWTVFSFLCLRSYVKEKRKTPSVNA